MLPFFAIGCFAGLRPEEIKRLKWQDIDLVKREIYVPPEVSKIGMDRNVPMSENLVQWLELIPEPARRGEIYWRRAQFETVRRRAKLLSRWTHDVMRHSAASHLFAKTQNYEATLASMGHGLQIFLRHYKRAVSQKQGEEYFDIRPGNARGGVLELPQAASA